MAKRDPKYISDFKEFLRGDITIADLPGLENELYGTNDRAKAVMLCSIVESALDALLKHHLHPTLTSDDRRLLFDYTGPLGTFSARTIVAYAFKLLGPETRHDLDLIRLIRNGFAHCKKSFGFTTPQVAAVCAALKAPDWPGAFVPHAYLARMHAFMSDEEQAQFHDRQHPRTRWVVACHFISDQLLRNAGRGSLTEFVQLRVRLESQTERARRRVSSMTEAA